MARPLIHYIQPPVSRFGLSIAVATQQSFFHRLPIDTATATPYPGGFAMQKLGRASDQECLRLMLAFFRIDDPRQRLGLIALAEWFAVASRSEPRETPRPALQDNRKPIRRRT
jgi:hypothetical protein